VNEQRDVIAKLSRAVVLSGVRWAYLSAVGRSLETYSEADGHDAPWLGNTRFTLLRDRLDRVFACGRYAVHPGDDESGLFQLFDALSATDRQTMPRVPAGLVRRCDLNGSPGWAVGDLRFLLASGEYGKLDSLPWPQKSATKQRVARQPSPAPPQPSLFDAFAPGEVGGLAGLAGAAAELDLVTYVVAHSLDPVSKQFELIVGRPRLNAGGGQAWYWCHDLLGAPPSADARRGADAPAASGPDPVPDAEIRLRRPADRHGSQYGAQHGAQHGAQRDERAAGGR
jgi:hypothetical protein